MSTSLPDTVPDRLPTWDDSRVRMSDEAVVIQHSWHALRRLMWDYVGIERTNRRLKRAENHISVLEQESTSTTQASPLPKSCLNSEI